MKGPIVKFSNKDLNIYYLLFLNPSNDEFGNDIFYLYAYHLFLRIDYFIHSIYQQ